MRKSASEWVNPRIPAYAPRSSEERAADPYDKDFNVVDGYTGFAYGHLLFEEGAAEGLYRTMNAMLLARRGAGAVLDVGCGVGRTLYDCAPLMPETQFTGLDYSYHMCLRADQILHGVEPVPLPSWDRRGRPNTIFHAVRQCPNVEIVQGDAQELPFDSMSFDLVLGTLVLCRLRDPAKGLAEMMRVLRSRGTLLLSTPLAFSSVEAWSAFADAGALRGLLKSLGFEIQEWFDGLRFRELIDARGNAHDWNVRVIAARLRI